MELFLKQTSQQIRGVMVQWLGHYPGVCQVSSLNSTFAIPFIVMVNHYLSFHRLSLPVFPDMVKKVEVEWIRRKWSVKDKQKGRNLYHFQVGPFNKLVEKSWLNKVPFSQSSNKSCNNCVFCKINHIVVSIEFSPFGSIDQ